MAHKHRLRFTHRGVEFLGMEGWPSSHRYTWDFVCVWCPYTYRADRNVMIKLMTRRTK